MSYAKGTTVPVVRSRAAVESLLIKHGATQIRMYSDIELNQANVSFTLAKRFIRLDVPLPHPKEVRRIGKTKFEAECRRAWRVVILMLKCRFELIDAGSTVEQEFLSYMLLPNGATVLGELAPKLEAAYETGIMPPLLPGIGGTG